jgi:arginine N-succinyltransferase
MQVVRPVRLDDLDQLFSLIGQAEYGLTTLQVSRELLEDRIRASLQSFNERKGKPAGQPYVFVLEDLTDGSIVGTSAIYSKVGGYEPFYSYEIKKSIHESKQLGIRKEIDVLHLKKEHNGPTEIGSLFLDPEYWGAGHGRLLSMSRFLFMADFLDRFDRSTIAELRGIVNADGRSPVWDAIGSHFFQVEFPKAETLTNESKSIIADLMPEHPIYIPLLPAPAQQAIGRVHQHTEPALAMLLKEGFRYSGMVDIFDGGATVICETAHIRTVRDSRRGTIDEIATEVDADDQLLSNCSIGFRACLGKIRWNGSRAVIDQVTALRLGCKTGDSIRSSALKPPPVGENA